MSPRICTAVAVICTAAASAHAGLTVLGPGPMLATPAGNLVTNGSFEFRNAALQPGPGSTGSAVAWATGTSLTPFAVPYGWTSSGGTNTYALWGGNLGSPVTLRGSAPLPDGLNALYFGNGQGAATSQPPTFNPNGEVTFPSPPVVTPPGGTFPVPCTITQTVPTHLTPSPSYLLSFWVSGESAWPSGPGLNNDGIFGMQLTNTEPGDPTRFFAVPGGSGLYGSSLRIEISFTPLNPLLPVTLTFINWGHFNLAPWGGAGTTELVLDDVIINAVPAPSASLALLLAGAAAAARRRRAHA
ncbi:MAG: PEP-CTERM sorting domain-containing protein [Phycisphaerales bacterium]|nr:PEP-CTERM sorting domain-containing protein [Phycisphaerales bacterium]